MPELTGLTVEKKGQWLKIELSVSPLLIDALSNFLTEIGIPAPAAGTKSKFIKFALRKSIDFPVVNCAAAITSENGRVKSARICLNAVYNLPYRVIKAEEYLQGKQVDEETAEAAAGKITDDVLPVINNAYKIQIARTLVKRAILACL